MRAHDSFLGRLEETLSRASEWVVGRERGGEQRRSGGGHGRFEALRREIAEARRALRETSRADLARVRAGLDDLRADYDVPPPHTGLTRAELEAFRRHLHTTARLVRDLSTADSPRWNEADEEYERSWAEVERARSEGEPASP
jgi:hypothetical protein